MLEISDDINEVIKGIENMTLKVESSMKKIEVNMKNSFDSIAISMNQVNTTFESFSASLDSSSTSQTVFDNSIAITTTALGLLSTVIGAVALKQDKLNIAVLNNPYVIAAAAIVALVGVIGGLIGSMSEENSKHQETMDAINKEIEARDKMKSKQQELLDGNLSEISNIQALYNELATLVDADGRVSESNKNRASFITTVLNDALGTQMKVEGDLVSGYSESEEAIGTKIEKLRAEAILEAQLPAYKKALLEATKAQMEADKLEAELTDLKMKKKETAAKLEAKYGDDWVYEAARKSDTLLTEWANLDIDTKKKEEEYKKQNELVKGYYDDQANYETNAALISSGNVENYKKVQMDAVTALGESVEEKKSRVDSEKEAEAGHLEYLRELRANATDDEMIRQLDAQIAASELKTSQNEAELNTLNEQIKNAKEQKTKGNTEELEDLGNFITEKEAKLVEMYAKDEANRTVSDNIELIDLQNSISSKIAMSNKYAEDKISSAVDLSKKLSENSTQQEKDAAAKAMEEAEKTLQILGNNAMNKLNILEDLKQRRKQNDKSVTDEMIAEAERQAVEAEAGYGKVAKKIEKSWKDLPESSKKTFKDVMDPMLTEMEKKEPTLFEKANGIAKGILGNLKKAFDINSPSRKVRKIFNSVMEGAELGLKDETPDLLEQSETLSTRVLDIFTKVKQSDIKGMVKKMQSAINLENLQMKGIVNSSYSSEMFASGRLKVELPELNATIKGKIENHIMMDGRETAVQLTPFISEELAFNTK